jgi:N-acylglucosamine-6-phosphate 2-epimerase
MTPQPSKVHPAFDVLRRKLIVSCQAAEGSPLRDTSTLSRIAASVLNAGAGGLRAEGVEDIRAFRKLTRLPIIGIRKKLDAQGGVYITPDFASARAISEAGADIVALDCTHRRLTEPEPWPLLIQRIHKDLGKPVMADIASLEDAIAAATAGADAVATTLYGYTDETAGIRTVSWPLVEAILTQLEIPVIIEGHVKQPQELQRAFQLGVHAVVVGSAITSPESITARFVAATTQSS